MSVYISSLPVYTGSASDLRWFIMNNSGETQTFRYSGYNTSITYGLGINSIQSTNATQATGARAIAIGYGASSTGDDSVCIGDVTGNNIGTRSVSIGKHGQVAGNSVIAIGSGAYVSGTDSIAIGSETAAYNGGIVLGGNTSRATSIGCVTIGNSNERNLGAGYSSIMGYGNKVGDAPNYNPGPYNNIISSFSVINGDNSTIGYNSIFGGSHNYITGTTSGATLINTSGLTSVGTGDIVINSFGNTITGTGEHKQLYGGFGNTISGSGTFGTIINGNSNSITGGINNSILGGQSNTNSSTRGTILGGINNQHSGTNGVVLGGEGNNATGWIASVGGYNNTASAEIGFVYGNQCIGQGQTIGIVGAEHGRTLGSTYRSFIGGGLYNWMTDATNSAMIGGMNNTITGGTNIAMIACSGRTATTSQATFVENLVVFNYAALDFANDTAAAAGGVVLGQIYHNNGAMRIRIV